MTVIECSNVTKTYGTHQVLNDMNFTIGEGVLTGVIGRNGVGKTTLMKMIAGFLRESSGTVQVFGEKPFNNLKVSANTIFIDDAMNFPDAMTLQDILHECRRFYPNWDADLAGRLISYFGFHQVAKHRFLSKGKKSTFNAVIGIAAHCPLTIFDEPTTGMDAAVRKDFYRALLKDYLAHPRTILLSSHHMEEIEDLLEDILLVHDGTIQFHGSITVLQEMFVTLQGKAELLAIHTEGKNIVNQHTLGPYAEWTVENIFTEDEIKRLKADGITISPVSANDTYIALTAKTKGAIDDVFDRTEIL
ncbi:ABC transporter ATP-binding protein [Sporosarcina sp. NPDC096371]|uniref:ABC transporter ATP-binding protein n=1 Tax=Sporosarcina sp. NPDC096371 TaxID=3364530 RepID=UPI00381C18D5